ncbi:hypothetical protein BC941DRAFT_420875 [Chlamydoabsidia padenii]|nr:hypothetical protein BC941DRAFT_420875 [Chlamydoabsidia padenii]
MDGKPHVMDVTSSKWNCSWLVFNLVEGVTGPKRSGLHLRFTASAAVEQMLLILLLWKGLKWHSGCRLMFNKSSCFCAGWWFDICGLLYTLIRVSSFVICLDWRNSERSVRRDLALGIPGFLWYHAIVAAVFLSFIVYKLGGSFFVSIILQFLFWNGNNLSLFFYFYFLFFIVSHGIHLSSSPMLVWHQELYRPHFKKSIIWIHIHYHSDGDDFALYYTCV